jgi:phosphoglycolate phosphatase
VARQIKGVVFDLDGTLLDDIGLARDLPFLVAESYGISVHINDKELIITKVFETLSGSSSKIALARALLWIAKKVGLPWYRRGDFIKRADKIYKEKILESDLFPHAMETVEIIQRQYGKVGILSTTPLKEIQFRLQKRPDFLAFFGTDIIGGDGVKNVKPHPEGLILLAKLWNVLPQELVFIGDMAIDMVAAQRAGCISIGFLGGHATESTLKIAGAQYIINELTELPPLLELIGSSKC